MSVSMQVPIPETEQVPSSLDTNTRPFEHSFGVVLVVNAGSFMVEILSGFSSVIHIGCLKAHERHPLLGIGLAPITPFGAGLAGLIAIGKPILCFFGSSGIPSRRGFFKISHIGIEARIVVVDVFLRDTLFVLFRDDGGDVGDDRAIHPRFCASVFSIPDKTDLVDAEINFRDDFGAVLLLGVVEVAKHHIRCCGVLVTVDKLLLGRSNDTVNVDGDDLPTLTNKVESGDGRCGEGASEDCGGFHNGILSRVMFPAVCIREAHGLLDKPFSTGKSAVLREPAEPSISNASRDAANLTPVNSGFPTPTKLFFALGAFCAECCSRQPVHKRLLPEAHHEEVAACASLGLLTLSGGLCLPVAYKMKSFCGHTSVTTNSYLMC